MPKFVDISKVLPKFVDISETLNKRKTAHLPIETINP